MTNTEHLLHPPNKRRDRIAVGLAFHAGFSGQPEGKFAFYFDAYKEGKAARCVADAQEKASVALAEAQGGATACAFEYDHDEAYFPNP